MLIERVLSKNIVQPSEILFDKSLLIQDIFLFWEICVASILLMDILKLLVRLMLKQLT